MHIKGPDDHGQIKWYQSPFNRRALKSNMGKKYIKFEKLIYLIHLFLKQLFYGQTKMVLNRSSRSYGYLWPPSFLISN